MNITNAVLQLCFQWPDDYSCSNGEDVLLLCIRQDINNSPGELVAGCTGYLPEFYEKVCTKQEFLAECERIKKKAPAEATHALVDPGGITVWFRNVSLEVGRAQYTRSEGDGSWYNAIIDVEKLIPLPKPWPRVGDVVEYQFSRNQWCKGRVVGFDGTNENPDLYVVLSTTGFAQPECLPPEPTYVSYQRCALRTEQMPSEQLMDEATIREAIEIIRPFAGNGMKIQELARRGYLKRPEQKG